MPARRADELTSRVLWSTSPPKAPRCQTAAPPRYSKATLGGRHFTDTVDEYRAGKTNPSHWASPTVELESNISNPWFELFTERLLQRNQRPPSFKQSMATESIGHSPGDTGWTKWRHSERGGSEGALSKPGSLTERYESSKPSAT